MKKSARLLVIILAVFASCKDRNNKSDAYGTFEAVETTISPEVIGKLISFGVEEGKSYPVGALMGIIDTTDYHLKRLQLRLRRNAALTRVQSITAQYEAQAQQRSNLLVEMERLLKLIKDEAATQKQIDDLNGKIKVIEKQLKSIDAQKATANDELAAMEMQLNQLEETIRKCYIVNPVQGIVLARYAEAFELVYPIKPLYKIAPLDEMILKVYVSGSQLPAISIGQKVKVLIDKNRKENRELEGVVSWVSEKAEFTPKIIQTKEERVNLVYALKIIVKNDGTLKIGMPGEVIFEKTAMN